MEKSSFTITCNRCGNERELVEGQHRVEGPIAFTMLAFKETEDTIGMICGKCGADVVMGNRFGK